jgi:hypothetical protein
MVSKKKQKFAFENKQPEDTSTQPVSVSANKASTTAKKNPLPTKKQPSKLPPTKQTPVAKIKKIAIAQSQATADEVRENVKGTFNLHPGEELDQDKVWSTHETQKLILMAALNQENIKSMTNLNDDEIEDIENALMLNMIGNNPLVAQVCNDHMLLKRSLTHNPISLIEHLFNWSTRGLGSSSILDPVTRVLGKKGSN